MSKAPDSGRQEVPDAGPEREAELAARREAAPDASMALARRIAEIADSKKAEDIVGLDMRGLVGYTDFVIVCTALNERQAKAIHDEVYERLKHEEQRLAQHVEGEVEARWVLMDYLDCILHVFVPEMRQRYRLEMLWGEAPRLELGLPE